jgi:hypothetical protein
MKQPQWVMILLAAAFCYFAPQSARGESCYFIENVGTVCVGDEGGEFEWESTSYFDLTCVAGGGGSGGSSGSSGSGAGAGGMNAATRSDLERAMTLAMLQLEREKACKDMYRELGFPSARGDILLMTTHYANGQGAIQCALFPDSMFTFPGSGQVWVCPQWHEQDLNVQTRILLHESLHTAGALETPSGGVGYPTSADYSGFVRARCKV